jgi:hypothetical protein
MRMRETTETDDGNTMNAMDSMGAKKITMDENKNAYRSW